MNKNGKIANEITILESQHIDKNKWDACVDQDSQATIYNKSIVLDSLSDKWKGIVIGNYRAVMPLPIKSGKLFPFLYQPPFSQRNDIAGQFTTSELTAIQRFIGKQYKLVLLASSRPDLLKINRSRTRTNYIIRLDHDYETIKSNYHRHCLRNIKKMEKYCLQLTHKLEAEQVIEMFKAAYGNMTAYKPEHYQKLLQLLSAQKFQSNSKIIGVEDENATICYAVILLKDKHRIYYLLPAPTDIGKQKGATYFFIDQILKKYASSGLIFDFEGSDITPVASFYSRFGAEKELYYQYQYNKLNFPLKQLVDCRLKKHQSHF